ncbi:MAG: glycoside-pentoside-hexuronide (GPH):cation symporter [Clostridia bacterium]|nr:glycoside-pentoside-hexuronide (GPH):cation symporter [Clostridia bacterium]
MEKLLHKVFGTTPGKGVQPKEAVAYSITGFGQNLICTIIGSYLTVFLTDALLFGSLEKGELFKTMSGATAVALLMLLTRVYDALNDPIMGSIVDKTRTKWGKCRPFLKWMAVPIAISTVVCFLPFLPERSKISFVVVSAFYVIWSMVYTVADVPYWGLSTCLTNDTIVRGNILTVARLVCTLGAGIVTVFVPVITNAVNTKTGNDPAALRLTYFICAVVCVVAAIPMFFYGFKNTKERFTANDNPPSFSHNIKLLFKNDQLILIVLSGVFGGARMVYTYTGGLYFAKYVLQNEGLFGLITMLVVPGGLVASLLVPWMTKKFTKKWAYIGVHLFGGVVMTAMYFIGYDAKWKLIVAGIGLVLLGIPQGVNNIITYAMIGDTVDYLEWKTGERGEGICFAMQTLINKIGMAVGAFVGVMSYSWAGIDPSKPIESAFATPEGPGIMWSVLILSGAVSMFACAIPMFFYKVTEKRQAEMIAEIAARKEKEN